METIKITISNARNMPYTVKISVKKSKQEKKDVISKIADLLKNYQCENKDMVEFKEKKN